jgi:stage V sporulation protein S
MSIIKVASTSRTALVAGAIAGMCRESGGAEVQAIGAAAVNQAIKAVIIAKGYLSEEGKAIVFTPSFVELDIEGQIRTGVRLTVEQYHPELDASQSETEISAPQ